MRLADDERARVPFALIGVVLLVGSLAVVTVQFEDERIDRDVRLAGDRAEASAETALRDVTRAGGASATADPVVEPADGEFGALLSPDRPFRDYLELLVAIRLRERAAGLEQRVDDARATIEFPPIDDAASADAALERTTVTAAGTGLVNVTVADATVVVRQDRSVVDRRDVELSATVTSPALTLHDRTERFERLLDRGPRTDESASRGLTGGLYALGWARGWGQYAGLPIEQVIANRHVELVTNLAVLDAQRVAFGRADRDAERDLAAEATRVVANETVGLSEGGVADAALPVANADDPSAGEIASPPTRTTVVGVNESAERALADVVEPCQVECRTVSDPMPAVSGTLAELVHRASSIEATVTTATDPGPRERVSGGPPDSSDDWDRQVLDTDRSLSRVEPGDGPEPPAPGNWSLARLETRTAVVTEDVTVRYTQAGTGNTTERTERYRRTVGVGVALRHRPRGSDAPSAPLAAPDDGLSGRLVDHAETVLVDEAGGVDALARAAVRGEPPDERRIVGPSDVGADLETEIDAVYEDLTSLRERLRPVQLETEQAFVATDADPAAELARRLEAGRSGYVRVPATYDDLEHRATVAARAAYVDRTIARVRARSVTLQRTQDALAEEVEDLAALPRVALTDLLEIGLDYARPEPTSLETRSPAPNLSLTVDADPSYLDLDAVNETRVPPPVGANETYYPLAARTRTVGSVPGQALAEQVAGVVVDLFEDREELVPASVAARTLHGADRLPSNATGGPLQAARGRLRGDVAGALDTLEGTATQVVVERTDLGRDAAADVVAAGVSRWNDSSTRVLAFQNGSAAATVATAAERRSGVDELDADRVETVLADRVPSTLALEGTQVPADRVESVAEGTRSVATETVADATERGAERAGNALASRFGAVPVVGLRGMPLVPAPGWWLASANVWAVEVEGTYASFQVRARQGAPDGTGHVSYVRDGGPVGVDVTGDGAPERLGRSTRLSFDAETAVVVVVPPYGSGVGNVDDDFDQSSPGWEQR